MAEEVGRPSKLTELTVKKLEEAFAMDCSVLEACLYAGISRPTFYAWIKENKELSNRFEELRENPVLKARTTVVNVLNEPEHAKWYLERKRKREFSQRQELTGRDGEPLVLPSEIIIKNGINTNGGATENSNG